MAAIKQLAGQTLWYGVSNIGSKLLNQILTPLLTYLLHSPGQVKSFGDFSLLYSWIAVANILFTYGFETGYFRFSNKEGVDRKNLFSTTFSSLIISTFGLVLLFSLMRLPISMFLDIGDHPEYLVWCLCVIGFDTLAAIPFARLRQENRPKKYAFVKISGIVINILLTVFFLVYLPTVVASHPDAAIAQWYQRNSPVGFLILANLVQNVFVFFILFNEWKDFKFKLDTDLWKKIFAYSSPMIIIGLGGMINEVMDRQMLAKFLPLHKDQAMRLVAIYSANYRFAIFITLFIQAFKMAAEPFFFSQANDKNAPYTYAKIMKWFVIILSLAFLFTAMYIDILKYWIGPNYRSGLGVVPILLGANICLGIYYNLSVWYKLTDNMRWGLYITVIGAIITLVGNYLFIPQWGYYAAAWTTFTCYFLMVIMTYFIGHKYFPVPYAVKKLLTYLTVMLMVFFVKKGIDFTTVHMHTVPQLIIRFISATALIMVYLALIVRVEKAELKGMPLIGKYLK